MLKCYDNAPVTHTNTHIWQWIFLFSFVRLPKAVSPIINSLIAKMHIIFSRLYEITFSFQSLEKQLQAFVVVQPLRWFTQTLRHKSNYQFLSVFTRVGPVCLCQRLERFATFLKKLLSRFRTSHTQRWLSNRQCQVAAGMDRVDLSVNQVVLVQTN